MKVVGLSTSTSDDAEAAIRPFFPSVNLGGGVEDRPFAFRLDAWEAAGTTLLEYTIDGRRVRGTTDMPGFTVSENEVDGRMMAGRDPIDTSAPYSVPHHGMTAEMDWVRTRAVMVDVDAVQRFARADLGEGFEVRNIGTAPVSAEAGAFWASSSRYLHERMLDGTADEPLVGASLSQFLVSAYLHAFRTTWSEAVRDTIVTPRVSGAVRRASQFLDDNRHRPVEVAEVAAVARLSIRGLQAAFRRELGVTPMEYLRRARLDAVREELLAADPTAGGTVTTVARRWGFVHLGRFAEAYRAAYGELPRITLHR